MPISYAIVKEIHNTQSPKPMTNSDEIIEAEFVQLLLRGELDKSKKLLRNLPHISSVLFINPSIGLKSIIAS